MVNFITIFLFNLNNQYFKDLVVKKFLNNIMKVDMFIYFIMNFIKFEINSED